eukprot:jgi/Picre1/34176/NNA_001650.t1
MMAMTKNVAGVSQMGAPPTLGVRHASTSVRATPQSRTRQQMIKTQAVGVDVTEAVGMIGEASSNIALAVGGSAAVAALSAVLIAADPEKRRAEQMKETDGDELEAVKKYFNTSGFDRWRKIYGETDDVNKVQLDIREGHAQTVEKVLKWIDEEGGVEDVSVCDAGCGTGSLAIPLALRGAAVSASDISAAMASEAERRFNEEVAKGAQAPRVAPVFEAKDLESCSGKYNTVTCLDVMIHYPQNKAEI